MTYLGAIGRGLLRQKMAEYRKEQEASTLRGNYIRITKKKLILKFEMENTKTTLEETSHPFESVQERKTDQSDDILFQDSERQDQSYEKFNKKFADVNVKDKHHDVTKQLNTFNRRCNESYIYGSTKSIPGKPIYASKQTHRSGRLIDNKMGHSFENSHQNVDSIKDKNDNEYNDEFADAALNEKYHELIEKLDAFQVDDDGIKFNIKIRNILDYFKERSRSPLEFDELFRFMYKSCLCTKKLIPKFVKLITSRSIQKMEIRERKFLPEFLKLLQHDFEHREVLQRKNIEAFRNVIVLMGEFLAVKKDFEPVKESLLVILEMLLHTAEESDIVLFLEQVFVNRNNLGMNATSPLLIQVRTTLINKKDLPSESRARLMLVLDLVLNPASLKSEDVMNLYQDLLGVQ